MEGLKDGGMDLLPLFFDLGSLSGYSTILPSRSWCFPSVLACS